MNLDSLDLIRIVLWLIPTVLIYVIAALRYRQLAQDAADTIHLAPVSVKGGISSEKVFLVWHLSLYLNVYWNFKKIPYGLFHFPLTLFRR